MKKIAFAVVWVFASVIASQFVWGLIMSLILGSHASDTVWVGVYSVLSYGSAVALTLFVLPKVSKKWSTSREELGLSGYPTWTDLGLSPVGYILSTLLAAGAEAFFNIFPWFNATEAQSTGFAPYLSGWERIIAFLVLVVLAPIMEEVIFRGWLYGKLRSRTNMVVAILITSVLFGAMHLQWNVGVNVFCLSVVLCGLREVTGTIYSGILVHVIKNGVAFYLLYVLGM